MLRLCAGLMVAILILSAQHRATAVAPDPVAENAALHYWRAFGVLPSLNDKQEEGVRNAVEKSGPVDEEAAKAIELGRSSLKELHRGITSSRCAWATPLEEGADVLIPYCAKARQLARLACARAELGFQQGKPAAAADDLMAAMTLGRHVTTDGIMICLLVDIAIERQAIGVAARHLGELPPAQLDAFAARLDRLPAPLTMRQAVQAEKDYLIEGAIRALAGPEAKEKAELILKVIAANDDAKSRQLRETSPQQLRDAVIALRPVFDKVVPMMDRPPTEVESPDTLLAGLNQPAQAAGMRLLPPVLVCRTTEAAHQTRLAMLKAAVAVVRSGPDALKRESFKDPYGGGPFSYEKTSGGFRLVSKTLDRDGKPVTMEFGQELSK